MIDYDMQPLLWCDWVGSQMANFASILSSVATTMFQPAANRWFWRDGSWAEIDLGKVKNWVDWHAKEGYGGLAIKKSYL